ncbi:MAG: response regulator [Deltaproteobacteria bacterium]|nr:response regulator [Deltaproteobacteria bacterium]
MDVRALGDLLVEARAVTPEACAAWLAELPSAGELVVRARMLPTLQAHEREIAHVLAARIGAPVLVLGESTLDLRALDVLPADVAVEAGALPAFLEGDVLTVAVATESDAVECRLAAVTGRSLLVVLALPDLLAAAATLARTLRAAGETTLAGPRSTTATPCLALVRPPAAAAPAADDVARALGDLLSAALESPASPPTGDGAVSPTPPAEAGRAASRSLGALKLKQVRRVQAPPQPLSAAALLGGPAPIASPRDLIELPPLPAGDGPRALVVEDDDAIRTLLTRVLRADGLVVEAAGDGRTALALMRRRRPDLVVLDAMLPEIHGFEICAAIKKSEQWSAIPVLMISAVFRGFDNARTIQEVHGADVFIEKPFDLRHVRHVVADLLQRPQPVEQPAGQAVELAELARARAAEHHAQGNVDGVVEAVRQWLDADPFHVDAWLLLGRAEAQRSDSLAALRAFERAATYGRIDFRAQIALATAYESFGFVRRARAVWLRAAACAPDETAAQKIRSALAAWR